MYKEDLALDNLQWLICHKTEPNPKHVSNGEKGFISHEICLFFSIITLLFDTHKTETSLLIS